VDVDVRVVERTKETQSLYMVHVEMCEEDVDSTDIRWDLCSKPADAGAGVEDQNRTVALTHLNG
jgi:hypothetical protein